MVWVCKCNKKITWARVPDPDSLYRFRDYPEDDDLEFVTHGPAIDEERVASGGSDKEVEHSLARKPERRPVAPVSQETSPALREAVGVIDITELPSHTKSLFDEAQSIK